MEPLPFDYNRRYVVFLDILGFKNKIQKIHSHVGLFEYLIRLPALVDKAAQNANTMFGAVVDAQATAFSDSLVISASASQPIVGLYTVATSTISVCQDLLHRRALVRGGMAKGDCYHRDNTVFGQAMNDAYLLESQSAKMPRVAVTAELAQEWRNIFGRPGGMVALKDVLTIDNDGVDFVDLFYFPERDSIDNTTFSFFKESGPNLRALLNEPDIGVREREKISWLAGRYNTSHTVRRLKLQHIDL